LAAALRANNTLTSFSLANSNVFHDGAAASTLLNALTGHPSLRAIDFKHNPAATLDDAMAIGDALGALVAANAPALTLLKLLHCRIGEQGGLRPLIEALRVNTHLRELHCGASDPTDAFAANVLLPAVRANTSLRELKYYPQHGEQPSPAHEAMQLVRARQ
jgi:hypothetical protein